AFFGITSIACSLEYNEHANFRRAAQIAVGIIEQILAQKGPEPQLYNLNIPTIACQTPSAVRIVPMGVARYGENFIKRTDPRGRSYYWAANNEPPPEPDEGETDLTALAKGFVTLTPLHYTMTSNAALAGM